MRRSMRIPGFCDGTTSRIRSPPLLVRHPAGSGGERGAGREKEEEREQKGGLRHEEARGHGRLPAAACNAQVEVAGTGGKRPSKEDAHDEESPDRLKAQTCIHGMRA